MKNTNSHIFVRSVPLFRSLMLTPMTLFDNLTYITSLLSVAEASRHGGGQETEELDNHGQRSTVPRTEDGQSPRSER